MAKWVEVAEACQTGPRDHLSLFAIVSALTSPRLRGIKTLWNLLAKSKPEAVSKLDCDLAKAVKKLNCPKSDDEEERPPRPKIPKSRMKKKRRDDDRNSRKVLHI